MIAMKTLENGMYPKTQFVNSILREANECGELLTDDRFTIIICPHSNELKQVVAMKDDDEPNGYLCLHNSDDDGSNDFHDVTLFHQL